MATSILDAAAEAPANTDGIATGDSTWRFAVQILTARYGNRVGFAHVDTAYVGSDYIWRDLTSDIWSIDWTVGGSGGAGFPSATVGVLNFSLINEPSTGFTGYLYSLWRADLNYAVIREFSPGAVVRVLTFKPGCSAISSTDVNGITTVTRTDWTPLFTGVVESWNESIGDGRNHRIDVTCVDTLSLLAKINTLEIGAIGTGDTLAERTERLLDAAGWKFGMCTAWEGADDTGTSATYTLQSTTMANNRLGELKLSAVSARYAEVTCNPDGRYSYGMPPFMADVGDLSHDGAIPRFISDTFGVFEDSVYFPNAVAGYFSSPLDLRLDTESVINDLSFARVGGTAESYTEAHSAGLYGKKSLKRYDLICQTDLQVTQALNYAKLYTGTLPLTGTSPPVTRCTYTDQAIQPGRIMVTDQQALQRSLVLHSWSILDYVQPAYVSAYSPMPQVAFRFMGRITSMQHTVQRTSTGVLWSTEVSIYSQYNYQVYTDHH